MVCRLQHGGLLVAAPGGHDIADQPDHQQPANDSQADQQKRQHAGQDAGGQDDTEDEHHELAQTSRPVAVIRVGQMVPESIDIRILVPIPARRGPSRAASVTWATSPRSG